MTKKNAVNWFELYCNDFDRATRFYNQILKASLQLNTMGECKMAIFPYDNQNGVGGSITLMEGISPGPGGTMVYLNVEGDLDGVLSRVAAAGGAVIRSRMSIGEHGFIGIIKDSEGNVVGLHSMD
ncbi:MAG TPA: VOC family protein [Candidatus Limnocylindria bacterium]|jgi:predicted enzyme related to lactoylglutathione lyase|nr:VOC family protein [Candidatus Limnocylindria bacterium]